MMILDTTNTKFITQHRQNIRNITQALLSFIGCFSFGIYIRNMLQAFLSFIGLSPESRSYVFERLSRSSAESKNPHEFSLNRESPGRNIHQRCSASTLCYGQSPYYVSGFQRL